MKLIKQNVKNEDKQMAIDIINRLKAGDRTFGAPAEGLKKTLKKLEENAPKEDSYDDVSYTLDDRQYAADVARLKKGIKGEEILAQYFEKVIRLDPVLSDIIVFASLGDESSPFDYIPDTDFLCIYGQHLLAVDAKNINTNPGNPLYVEGNGIYGVSNPDVPILEVNSSVPIWKKILSTECNSEVRSVSGCTCIVNKTGAMIFKNEDWAASQIKPVHISEFLDFLKLWCEGKDPNVDINLLTTIMKYQIKKPHSDMDLSVGRRMLGV